MKYNYRRTFAIIAVSVVFGVVVAIVKGSESGMRDSIGNMSAPWLLLPYMASTTTRGWKRGALMGLAACLAALAGFYVAEAVVLDLGGHPLLANLSLALVAGRFFFVAGAVCRHLFGSLVGLGARLRP